MKKISMVLIAALTMGATAKADIFSVDINQSWISTGSAGANFNLGPVASIKSISVEIAHTWGGDLEITLTGPGGSYVLMNREVATTGTGNYDLGQVAGSGALANVAKYLFVEGAPAGPWTAPFSAGGTYNANSWFAGGHAAGAWTFSAVDNIGGDNGAIGRLTIDFNPIPEPTSALALLGLSALAAGRRRR